METSVRLFQCARCQRQVLICTYCDRGNIYCQSCALGARQRSMQAAGRRYQSHDTGRIKHTQRQTRYRQRRKLLTGSVTHQGSQPVIEHDSLFSVDGMTETIVKPIISCHFCSRAVSLFVRNHFLRSHTNKTYEVSNAWAHGP